MGIRTYITAYKEVPNGEHCMGKTDLLDNWLSDNGCQRECGSLYDGYALLGEWERKELIKQITSVLKSKNKRKTFDKYFRESDYYTDYEKWFDDELEMLKDLRDWLQTLDKDVWLFATQC